MKDNWEKFMLLMWKNWILQYRKPLQTAVELLAPVLCVGVLVFLRYTDTPVKHKAVIYPRFCHMQVQYKGSACSEERDGYPLDRYYTYILYTPSGPALAKIMGAFSMFKTKSFNSTTEMENYYLANEQTVLAAVEFSNNYKYLKDISDIKNFRVAIRCSGRVRFLDDLEDIGNWNWATGLTFPSYRQSGPRMAQSKSGSVPSYLEEGFLTLQYLVLMGILANKETPGASTPLLSMRRFPHPDWHTDSMDFIFQLILGNFILLSFIYSCINIVKSITTEKENQLKESMKIIGLSNWLHWTAWFVKCFLFLIIPVVIIVVLTCVKWKPDSDYAVFTNSDPSVLFVFLTIYICATITLCFAISVMFNKANTAAALSAIIWIATFGPFMTLQFKYSPTKPITVFLFCLLSNTAMGFGFHVVLVYEQMGRGIHWKDLFSPYSPDEIVSMGLVMIMLIFDTILYMFLALYIEAVFPGEFGVAKQWNFFLSRDYWRSGTYVRRRDSDISMILPQANEGEFFETEPYNLPAGVQIKELRKVFHGKAAVERLSLNMFENQITVLLGHNGAGKTTTMSMLTGMLTPTSGTAKINGFDIRTEMDEVRRSLGLCPQHNIIFDQLTVEEHLYFCTRLKGLSKDDTKAEIDKYVRLLELERKRHSQSRTLSGGMKRKLCVGMALCGHSKVVMLDEPTAGMDPSARRAIWILLKSEKEGRTILLSTHFMDEADLLGDRIAIMGLGVLKCCGSSFFLKKKFGAGYNLILNKSPNCNVQNVTALLKKHIPTIEVHSNVGSELTYLLQESNVSKFQPMLKDLESNSNGLGILGYGISLTTMEEVFMKVGADNELAGAKYTAVGDVPDIDVNTQIRPRYKGGPKLVCNQFRAMFMKRILSTYRSWLQFLLQILFGLVFVLVAIFIVKKTRVRRDLPPLVLNMDNLYKPTVLIENNINSKYFKAYMEVLKRHNYHHEMTNNFSETMLKKTESYSLKARTSYVVAVSFEKVQGSDHITAWFNNDPYHSPGISFALALDAIYKAALDCNECSITFVNHPLPYDMEIQAHTNLYQSLGFRIAYMLAIAMAFITSFYLSFLVKERMSKAKHLQFVSGVRILVFWLTNIIWDLFTYIVICMVIIIFVACFQERGYRTLKELGIIPFFCTMIAKNIINNEDLADAIKTVFMVFPCYYLPITIYDSFLFHETKEMCDRCKVHKCTEYFFTTFCMDANNTYFDWKSPSIGMPATYSSITAAVLYIIFLVVEFKLLSMILYCCSIRRSSKKAQGDEEIDEDVAKEQRKVRDSTKEQLLSYAVVLRDLTKYYRRFRAVNGLWLAVDQSECFGLLGVNGAGKTTTFMMITGDVNMTSGDVFVNGFNVRRQLKQAQQSIGYCPQFDALLDNLTIKETIIMYAMLRGIPRENCGPLADSLAREFDFQRHLHKEVRKLSGGNKRKLSSAIAIIGDPPVVYLDEPTTGMDPATKRYLWNVLCKIRDSGKCIILTSHSMEECEALCTRMAIMVNGQFKCLGSSQQLKNKFAKGYHLIIKLKKPAEDTGPIEAFVNKQFPKVKLLEKHNELMYFRIKDVSRPWSEIFGILEGAKKTITNIEDYSLSQSSLEQVFLGFTRLQN